MASPYLMYDGAIISRESSMGKELARWEKPSNWTPEANQYPRMLYRAEHRPDGRRSVGEVQDSIFANRDTNGVLAIVPGAAEQWSRRCQLTVNNESEEHRAMENGWRRHPKEALELLESRDGSVSQLAAERHFMDARMSPQAQAEAAAVDASTLKHVASIPEKPRVKRKYVRRAKPEPPAA